MVLASRPADSQSHVAARPVGAYSRTSTPLAARIRSRLLTAVVLPTPDRP